MLKSVHSINYTVSACENEFTPSSTKTEMETLIRHTTIQILRQIAQLLSEADLNSINIMLHNLCKTLHLSFLKNLHPYLDQ